jgi:hypothetical protein
MAKRQILPYPQNAIRAKQKSPVKDEAFLFIKLCHHSQLKTYAATTLI